MRRVDVELGYVSPWNATVALGATHVFDTYPERLIPDNSFGIFLFPQGSPVAYNGRFIYVRTQWTFAGR